MTDEDTQVIQLPTEPDRVTLQARFLHLKPEELFDYWIEPELLCRWWPDQAEVDVHEGVYHFSWGEGQMHLRGNYTAFEPGRQLTFTWAWDHEPDLPDRQVTVMFEPFEGTGTLLTVTHGAYSKADRQERDGHLEGWTHFLTRLQSLQP